MERLVYSVFFLTVCFLISDSSCLDMAAKKFSLFKSRQSFNNFKKRSFSGDNLNVGGKVSCCCLLYLLRLKNKLVKFIDVILSQTQDIVFFLVQASGKETGPPAPAASACCGKSDKKLFRGCH